MTITNVGYSNIYVQEHWNRQGFNRDMTFFPKAREADCLVLDGNSVLRNTASTVKSISPLPALAGSLISGSAVLGGVLGIPIGLSGVRDSYKKGKAALSCGDVEGVAHNALWGSFGAGYTGISGMLAAEGVMGLQGTVAPAIMNTAFGGLGLAMNGALLAYSTYGLKQTVQYRKDLDTVLEKEGERGVVNWLNEQITLNRGELEDIRKSAKDPDRETANLLQKKWNALELRISPSCANLVREKLPGLLEKFDLTEAKNLIEEVKKANFKEKVKYGLMIVIALVSIAAFICLLLTTGPASPLLFALGAVTWLTVDSSKLHNYIGEKCWSWHVGYKAKTPELPCQTQTLED